MYILLGILFELLNKDKVTASEISKKYEISKRSVYRYIDALSISGVPVTTYPGKNGGICLIQKSLFDKTFFTKQEIDELLSLLQVQPNVSAKILSAKLNSLKK